jgi:type II secretory pathway component PulF
MIRAFFNRLGAIRLKERSLLYDRLALYLRSGVPISSAVSLVHDSADRDQTRLAYAEVVRLVSEGKPLSRAFSAFPESFSSFETSVLRVGEESGRLPESLTYLSSLLRRRGELTSRVRSALLYPFLVTLLTLGLTVFLVCYTFPKIIPLFRGLSTPLPLSTRVLIGITDLLSRQWLPLLAIGTVIAIGFTLISRLPWVLARYEKHMLSVPLMGPLVRTYHLAVLFRILSSLLQSGIPLHASLPLAHAGVPHNEFRAAIRSVEKGIYQGARVSDLLRERATLFPPSLIGLIAAGESTGSLAASFTSAAELCETELDERTRTLTTFIEPALMILTGLLVGCVAFAIVSPIYGITQNLSSF